MIARLVVAFHMSRDDPSRRALSEARHSVLLAI